MAAKNVLHELVDRLPESELQAAQRFLEYLCSAGVEIDDEPLSAEALAELQEAEESIARREYISLEELERKHNL
jgi:hypothetical protein